MVLGQNSLQLLSFTSASIFPLTINTQIYLYCSTIKDVAGTWVNNACWDLIENPEGKRTLERPRHICENNISRELNEC